MPSLISEEHSKNIGDRLCRQLKDGVNSMPSRFFEQRTEESGVKAQIIDKYYRTWAKIMASQSRSSKIGYVDLFAGPGRYRDGLAFVPLRVLENAIQDPLLRDRLVTIFNDYDANNSQTLKEEMQNCPVSRHLNTTHRFLRKLSAKIL
jgi:three-Cys-motif partner protein